LRQRRDLYGHWRLGGRQRGRDRHHERPGGELEAGFELHPDALVVRSLPELGTIPGARVLGEFGDERDRYASVKSRKDYAGTSSITRASGTKKSGAGPLPPQQPPG